MSKLEVAFKFEVGDLVYATTSLEDMRNTLGSPRAMIIQERVAQQCSGGVQLHYIVSNTGTPIKAPEATLVLTTDVAKEVYQATIDSLKLMQ